MQFDFIDALGRLETGRIGMTSAMSPDISSEEALARRLEESGRFRVLRRVEHRPVRETSEPLAAGLRTGIILDVETTGLDATRAEMIEIAMIAFTYDDVRIHDVVGVFEGRRQPRSPLPAQIRTLTGLTDADLHGQTIDIKALGSFVGQVDLIVAHNAAFDRSFCRALHPAFEQATWACSATDVDWKAIGQPDAKLGTLVGSLGLFHGAHRALDDVYAVLEVLTAPEYGGKDGAFARMVARARVETYEIRAERTPYDMRGILKGAGYRWSPGADGQPKAWVKTVPATRLSDETFFLRHEIYRDEALPVVRKLTASERFG